MVEDRSISGRIFDGVIYIVLIVISLLTMLPLLHVLAGSFTTTAEIARKGFVLIPTVWDFTAYRYIFSTDMIVRGLINSIGITTVGTLFSMFVTMLMAYALARRDLDGRRTIMFLVVFTMLFNGGIIPTFIIVNNLHLIDSYLALIVPFAVNAFNMIILKNFFQNLPDGLEESAKIDGCNDIGILFRIVLPLSMPAIATISLFYAVTYWNTYLPAILYLNDTDKWPVQIILRQIVIVASGLSFNNDGFEDSAPPPSQAVKMAAIVVATLPILMVYPFLQKHFAKGALLGSIKG